jgi:glycosyltransferase involved in cell wall biosynthesis
MNALPRKVLHVIDSLDLGGAQTFLLGLVNGTDRSRYLPEVACMHGRGVYMKSFGEAGIQVHSLSPGKMPPLYLPNFWRLMRRGGYDILHFHLFGANLCAKPLAIAAGHPAVVVHDQCNDASRERNPLLLAADAFWNRGSDAVIAVSDSVRRYLVEREDLEEDKVVMIPNGIDTRVFRPPSPEERVAAREKLGIPGDAFVIGGVGRLVPQKDFPLFLEVARRVLDRDASIRFVIAGSGPMQGELRAIASELALDGALRFLGHVDDRISIFRCLDLLLMTSGFEGTPMTLLESMACGIPAVASSVDGIAEVCTHGHDSFLALPGEAGAFAEGIFRILGNAPWRDKLSRNARATVVKEYDIRYIASEVQGVYERVLEKASSGSA